MLKANHAGTLAANRWRVDQSTDRRLLSGRPRCRILGYLLFNRSRRTFLAEVRRKSSKYTAVSFKIVATLADEAAGILIAHGASGCEVKKATGVRTLGRPREVYLHAYFPRLNATLLRRISKTLVGAGMLSPGISPSLHILEDPGWATMWQSRFDPLKVGERFLIVPPWNQAHHPGRLQIVINPGQAFGTGHHASTYGTLAIMEQLCRSHRFARALDVGTGSGILAFAMAKLGVPDITAIDIDPIALDNACENAVLNRLDGAIRLSASPLGSIRGRFDLVVANILSSVVIARAPQLKSRLSLGGHLVLAGILVREAAAVRAAYCRDLKLVATRKDGRWIALAFRR